MRSLLFVPIQVPSRTVLEIIAAGETRIPETNGQSGFFLIVADLAARSASTAEQLKDS
jgi:hypothetical protein